MDTNEIQKETEEVKEAAVVETTNEEQVSKNEEKMKETAATLKEKIKDNWKILLPLAIVVIVALAVWWGRSLFVAAIVDGEPISRLAVIRELEKRSGGQALDTMVIKKIILKRALERGVSISSDEVEQEITTLEGRMSEQGTTLDAALKEQGMTLDQFKEQIILQKALEKIQEEISR